MPLKRFRVEKLMRDQMPGILRCKGIFVHEKFMEQDEFITKLKEKLREEAQELIQAKNAHELTEELADLFEVMYAFSKAAEIPLDEIEKKRLEKRKTKGGFDKKICTQFVDIEEAHPSIEYYKDYPLIEEKPNCLFCQRAHAEVEFLGIFSHCYAIKDKYPVSKGHTLIIPHEHTENWFTASEEVRLDMMKAMHLLKAKLDLYYRPQGYNIGINCGEMAGQSVMHLHLHLIPRYDGDMENPKGGVRGVIPSKQKY